LKEMMMNSPEFSIKGSESLKEMMMLNAGRSRRASGCTLADQGVRVLERNDDAQCGSVSQPEPRAAPSRRWTITGSVTLLPAIKDSDPLILLTP